MQHAILITAYKNFNQLVDLINTFDSSFRCYIHIDKKSKFTEDQITELQKIENVDFAVRYYEVNWGGVNHLRAIILLMLEAQKDKKNHFFHLITGQDYPVKKLEVIKSFFEENENSIYMEYNKLPHKDWEDDGGYNRIIYYNFCDTFNRRAFWGKAFIKILVELQKITGFKRKFYDGFPVLYGGSTYWSINRNCIDYVINYLQDNPQYLERFKYTFCAEEFFFQTIIMSSPYKDMVVNDPLRYILWEEKNGSFPANLDITDEEPILKSNAIFARKFEEPVSVELKESLKKKLT